MSKPSTHRPKTYRAFFRLLFIVFIATILSKPTMHGQNGVNLIFDLDKGSFNQTKLSYKDVITITGKNSKEGKSFNAIQLTVTKLFERKKVSLKALRYDLSVIEKEIAGLKLPAGQTTSESKKLTRKKVNLEEQIETIETEIQNNTVFKKLWLPTGDETEFSFTLESKLKMNEEYSFEFQLYSKNTSKVPVDDLKNVLFNYMDSLVNKVKTGYKVNDAVDAIKPLVHTINTEVLGNTISLTKTQDQFSGDSVYLNDKKVLTLVRSFQKMFQFTFDSIKATQQTIPKIRDPIWDQLRSGTGQPLNYYDLIKPSDKTLIRRLIFEKAFYNQTLFAQVIGQYSFPDQQALIQGYSGLQGCTQQNEEEDLKNEINATLLSANRQPIDSMSLVKQDSLASLLEFNNHDPALFSDWLSRNLLPDSTQSNLISSYLKLEVCRGQSRGFADNLENSSFSDNPELYKSLSTTDTTLLFNLVYDDSRYDSIAFRNQLSNVGYTNIDGLQGLYALLGKEISKRDGFPMEKQNLKDSIEKELDFVGKLYVGSGHVKAIASGQSTTELDGIRLSTTYGIAAMSLKDGFDVMEWAQFLSVNIRFDDFDNELSGKDAYKTYWSRFSFAIGLVVTDDIQFNGQTLENTRLGFKPVIGLNYQPMRNLTLGAGMISFIPESINNGPTKTTVRPYLSLSFDFNLFNYLIQKK